MGQPFRRALCYELFTQITARAAMQSDDEGSVIDLTGSPPPKRARQLRLSFFADEEGLTAHKVDGCFSFSAIFPHHVRCLCEENDLLRHTRRSPFLKML